MKWFKGLLINFQFFSSIPIPMSLPMDKVHLEKAIKTFPLLGIFQGGVYALLLFLVVEYSPFSDLTATMAIWLAGILVTGGIHLDGWMDTSDAFFSYQEKEKRLEIMSDPRTGAFGVLSVVSLLALKFFFIYEIILMKETPTYFLLCVLPFFSRAVMGTLLLKGKAAKEGGLGSLFKNAANGSTLYSYLVYLILLASFSYMLGQVELIGIILFLIISVFTFLYLQKKTISWFGGTTGDVFGASVEGTELILWMTLWLLHYFVMG